MSLFFWHDIDVSQMVKLPMAADDFYQAAKGNHCVALLNPPCIVR